jgi:hypothetical protein
MESGFERSNRGRLVGCLVMCVVMLLQVTIMDHPALPSPPWTFGCREKHGGSDSTNYSPSRMEDG